jgi:transcriptional regulator with XRE-family HTH domain
MLDRDRLRMGRLRLRLTQQRLGELIGQDQAYVSRLERGGLTEITVTTLERIADVLGVSTDYLLKRKSTGRQGMAIDEDDEEAPRRRVAVGA